MIKYYIVYDGRADGGDTDEAAVLEALGHSFKKSDYKMWKDYDAVLFEYDWDGTTLINERKIGNLSMGYDALMRRIKS